MELERGGYATHLDQSSHEKSVVLRAGGSFNDLECMIEGNISNIAENEWSQSLYKTLYSSFRKHFKCIESYYLGQEAQEIYKTGVRFSQNIRAPKQYDFTAQK